MAPVRRDPARWMFVVAAMTACSARAKEVDHIVAATHGVVRIDGELDEPDWNRAGDPQRFTSGGDEARPYSQIRLLHDTESLYVGLYAADEDIRSSERFELTLGALSLAVDPLARVTPATGGVRAAKDVDGTIDHPDDEDEEWVIELQVPLATIGWRAGQDVPATARRCDTPKDGGMRCGSWQASLRLGP